MRKVASYLLRCDISDDQANDQILRKLDELVGAWVESKANMPLGDAAARESLTLSDGASAEVTSRKFEAGGRSLREVSLTQDVGGGHFETRMAYAPVGRRFLVYCELRASGEAYQVAPMRLDVRCPRIVRDILCDGHDWYVGDTLLVSSPVSFAGSSGGANLQRLLWHPDRNIPFVIVSEHDGRQLSENFSERLAADLSGLAIVGVVDQDAAWELTLARGKEWSCFNGAVRLFWPNLSDAGANPRHHPLWTRYSLLGVEDDPDPGADRLRRQLRRQILGLSAFSVIEPDELRQIKTDATRAEIESARDLLRTNEDWEELAQDYAKENDGLREEVDRQKLEISDLTSQVGNLQAALRWRDDKAEEVPPEPEAPPATVAEAVGTATERFANELLFGESIATGVQGLAKDAGPPEKILKYLETLAKMVRAQRNGPLGMSLIVWLKQNGLMASGESQTILNNKDEMKRRTWSVSGRDVTFDLHLKPAEATSPDRCVRIYFKQDSDSGKIAIGWIGRHP